MTTYDSIRIFYDNDGATIQEVTYNIPYEPKYKDVIRFAGRAKAETMEAIANVVYPSERMRHDADSILSAHKHRLISTREYQRAKKELKQCQN